MRILFVSSTYPDEVRESMNGIHQRMRMFMEALGALAELDVLFYVNKGVDASGERVARMEQQLREHWRCETRVSICCRSLDPGPKIPSSVPFSGRLKEWWFLHPHCYGDANREDLNALDRCLARQPDAVFVHRLNSMYPVLCSEKVTQPVFFDLDDVEHKAFIRGLKQPPFWRSKCLQYLKVPSLLWLERRAMKLARKTFVCSEGDRDYLSQGLRLTGVVSIPNAIEVPAAQECAVAPSFLFLGTYKYAPNAVAADHLIRRIWPLIRGEMPEARLVIAGEAPERIGCFGARHDGVEFTGYVADLGELYRATGVVCCPIRSGSGTRIKIIEAAAYGKPVVSTLLGAEGLSFVDGREILLRDEAELFAQACLELVRDAALHRRIGAAAREKVLKLYSRESAMKRIGSEVLEGL